MSQVDYVIAWSKVGSRNRLDGSAGAAGWGYLRERMRSAHK